MSIEDRTRWEHKHRHASVLTPRPSVLALPPPRFEGAFALDLACGQGRHAAVLRRAGFRVVAMDIAMPALVHARSVVGGVPEDCLLVQGDADAWPFAEECFDVVVQVDFLDRRLFPSLRSLLAPGGLLLIDTFLDQGRPNAEGPSNPDFLLRRGELPEAFRGFRIERYDEIEGESARATMLARKP